MSVSQATLMPSELSSVILCRFSIFRQSGHRHARAATHFSQGSIHAPRAKRFFFWEAAPVLPWATVLNVLHEALLNIDTNTLF